MALVVHGSGLLANTTGGLAVGVPVLGPTNGVYQNCCGGLCNCLCNTLPSSWTLEFHDCTHEQACLNGMTFEINRGDPLVPAGPFDGDGTCNGYVNGSYICEGGTGHVKWIGVNMDNSGFVYAVSIGMDSDQTFFGIPSWFGTYNIAGYLAGTDEHYDRWDCVNQSGTIAQTGSLMYFAFDYLHWGFAVDVTPNP